MKASKKTKNNKGVVAVNANGFFKSRKPCWEIRGCSGKPGGAPDCPACSNQQRPCWEWRDTICKGESGKDISVCQICEVYLIYGKGVKLGVPKKAPIKK